MLFGREELYKRYLTLQGRVKHTSSLAAVAGTSMDVTGAGPDLIKERDQLEADLVASDFPGGIAGFANLSTITRSRFSARRWPTRWMCSSSTST